MEIFNTITLLLSALLLFMVGVARIRKPIAAFSKNSGINLPNEINLLNEIRGAAGVQLLTGLFIGVGAFLLNFKTTATIIATIFFLGYAMGRLISIFFNGKPNKQLVQGLVFELVFGAMNFVCLLEV